MHQSALTSKLLDLFRSSSDKGGRVEKAVDLLEDLGTVSIYPLALWVIFTYRLEELRPLNTLNQVVPATLSLDDLAGLVAEDTNLLVGVLPAVALGDHSHCIYGKPQDSCE